MDSKKLVKATPKPYLLKDYLLEDFSSCSSSGFRSYPRRQCCTTVRFLVEIDMKKNNKQGIYKPKFVKNQQNYPKSSPSSTKLSTFQKASIVVINALKHFPFPKSLSTQNQTKTKLALLSKSLSKRLLKKTFWKKNELKEIEPWMKKKPEVMVAHTTSPKKPKPSMSPPVKIYSKSSGSKSSKKSDMFWDTDFTVTTTTTTTTTTTSDDSCGNNCGTNGENDVVLGEGGKVGDDIVGDDVESMEGTNSITNSEKASSSEEKEQFSPVSILDCPFDDEDEVSSPFRHRLTHPKGPSKRLTKKLQWFERHAQVEPINLEKKIIESPELIEDKFAVDEIEEEECVEEEALKLLQLLKATTPSYTSKLNADKLVSDLFREKLTFYGLGQGRIDDGVLLNAATDWIKGVNNGESTWDWKMQRNRQQYLREMEMNGEWKNLDEDNIEGIAMELEAEVFASVVDEVLGSVVE